MRKTNVGGQAVIEGVMMRGAKGQATAVRTPSKKIEVSFEKIVPITKKYKFLNIPFLRGVFILIDSLKTGISTLNYSASFFEEEEEESKFEKWISKKLGDKSNEILVALTMILSFGISIGLFIAIPTFIASLFKFLSLNSITLNLIESMIRIVILVVYMYLISKMDDIYRVYQYHGAEHKTIHCYEHNDPLTIENVRKYTTLHPRCGTAFLFVVMIISILVYSLLPRFDLFILNLLMRILFLPLVAGIAYEFNRFAGRSNGIVARVLRAPGLAMQYFTTKEPTDDMIEIAIIALIKALEIDEEVRNPDVSQPETIEQAPREELVL